MAVNNHWWTHLPKEQGGTDPVPFESLRWPWVILENQGQTLAGDGVFVPSYFTEVYWDPSLADDPTSVLTAAFEVDSVTHAGTDYWRLILGLEGWYEFEIVHEVDDPGDGDVDHYFQQRIVQTSSIALVSDGRQGSSAPWPATGAEVSVQQWLQSTRRIWRGPAEQNYEANIRQNTGVSKNVFGHLKVWYQGGLGGSTDNADWSTASA